MVCALNDGDDDGDVNGQSASSRKPVLSYRLRHLQDNKKLQQHTSQTEPFAAYPGWKKTFARHIDFGQEV